MGDSIYERLRRCQYERLRRWPTLPRFALPEAAELAPLLVNLPERENLVKGKR